MLILVLLIIFVFIPLVVRQEKRRKAAFRERKNRFMAIGAEYDDDNDAETPEFKDHRAMRTTRNIPPAPSRADANPYQPPGNS